MACGDEIYGACIPRVHMHVQWPTQTKGYMWCIESGYDPKPLVRNVENRGS